MARTAVVAGTATAVSNRVSRRQAGRWSRQAEEQQAGYADQQAYEEPPPAPEETMESRLAALQKLGELKAQGILTETEFEQQKSRILSGT
ncbi:SHOCT domain-containing protein [Paractinoplanes rishiriensis]|nr:SHOCT domain-containing protein [Actinoplanes rishiriensis]